MRKKDLLELIKDFPDDYEILFTNADERDIKEHSEMYLDEVIDSDTHESVEFNLRFTTMLE